MQLMELNESGEFTAVEVLPAKDVRTGGIFQLRQVSLISVNRVNVDLNRKIYPEALWCLLQAFPVLPWPSFLPVSAENKYKEVNYSIISLLTFLLI